MSHYARLITPIEVVGIESGARITIGNDTEIKRIKIDEHGRFVFEAMIAGVWASVATDADLPACTDKGSAHRARQVEATLRPGRPAGGGSRQERAIAFRPTAEQREWLTKHAKRHKLTLSALVRRGLVKLGMPR